MKRWHILIPYLACVMLGYGLASVSWWPGGGAAATVTRLSPDETMLARLVDDSPSWSIDRNFRIVLERLDEGKSRTIFRSPDEGHTRGTDRLIWSKDGTKLLLVGRHFFVKDDLFLDNGDQLYFLYDVPTGRGWCNADFPMSLPPLEAKTIEGIEFTEPVVMKSKM